MAKNLGGGIFFNEYGINGFQILQPYQEIVAQKQNKQESPFFDSRCLESATRDDPLPRIDFWGRKAQRRETQEKLYERPEKWYQLEGKQFKPFNHKVFGNF